MRQIKVELVCDWHQAVKDETVAAKTEYPIKVGRGQVKLVAVCDDCAEAWMNPMLAAVEAAQADDSVTEPRPMNLMGRRGLNLPLDCRERDCGYKAPTRSALGAHVKGSHDKRLRDYDWS